MSIKEIRQNYLLFTNASKKFWKGKLKEMQTVESDNLLKDIKQYEIRKSLS